MFKALKDHLANLFGPLLPLIPNTPDVGDNPANMVQPEPAGSPNQADVWNLVKEDMTSRQALGLAKYKRPVRAFNGRDALVDAYQEALDQSVYLRQEIERRRVLNEIGIRIAVIGPLTCDGPDHVRQNMIDAAKAGFDLFQCGFEPWIPHLSAAWETALNFQAPHGRWMRYSKAFIATCEAVLRLPSRRGNKGGTEDEEVFARELGIPVYHSILEIMTAFEKRLAAAKKP